MASILEQAIRPIMRPLEPSVPKSVAVIVALVSPDDGVDTDELELEDLVVRPTDSPTIRAIADTHMSEIKMAGPKLILK